MKFLRWLFGDAFAPNLLENEGAQAKRRLWFYKNAFDSGTSLTDGRFSNPGGKLADEVSQLRRTLASCDNREARLIETANETHEYAVWLHQMSFPGIDVPDTTIEIMTAIHRWMSAQSRELESLRAKIVESSDVKESIERTQEIVTELRDKIAASDAIRFPDSAATKLDRLVRQFKDLSETPEPQPNRGIQVSRMHFRQWAETMRSCFLTPEIPDSGDPARPE